MNMARSLLSSGSEPQPVLFWPRTAGKISNDKIQMPNEIQRPNVKIHEAQGQSSVEIAVCHLNFELDLTFEL
jgi:hypothetical protein